MKEGNVEGRIVMVYPLCRNCSDDIIMNKVNEEAIQTDEGYDMVYTYQCPRCGYLEESINIQYPYQKFIPQGM